MPASRIMAVHRRVFDDLDQVRELISRYDADHERDVLRGGRFRFAIQHRDGSRVQLARIDASPQRLRGTPRAFLLHVPREGRITYRIRGNAVEAFPGRAVLHSPGETFTSWSSSGTTYCARLEEAALRQEAAWLKGGDPEGLRFDPVVLLHTPAGRELVSLIVQRALASLPGGTRVLGHWEAGLIGAVGRVWLETSGDDTRLDRVGEERRRVRRVEEWIDTHFARPMTVGDLCRVAGLPARSLHRAFLRQRGQTPMRHVAQRRLAEARSRLLERRPGDSVLHAAFESGFTHLGRFASLYRATYGELPSESLCARWPVGSGQKAYPTPK